MDERGPGALQQLADRCEAVLDAQAVGIVLVQGGGEDRTSAPSTPATTTMVSSPSTPENLRLIALAWSAGPVQDAAGLGGALLDVDLSTCRETWTEFADASLLAGVCSASFLCLRRGGRVDGALVLFHPRHRTTSTSAEALQQLTTEIVTTMVPTDRSPGQSLRLARQLQTVRTTRVLVEHATGILAALVGIDVVEAAERLRQNADRRRTTITAAAAAVVDAHSGDDTGRRLNDVDVLILRLLGAEIATAAIARTVGLSLQHLGHRMVSIRQKVGVTSTAAAVAAIDRGGLL